MAGHTAIASRTSRTASRYDRLSFRHVWFADATQYHPPMPQAVGIKFAPLTRTAVPSLHGMLFAKITREIAFNLKHQIPNQVHLSVGPKKTLALLTKLNSTQCWRQKGDDRILQEPDDKTSSKHTIQNRTSICVNGLRKSKLCYTLHPKNIYLTPPQNPF